MEIWHQNEKVSLRIVEGQVSWQKSSIWSTGIKLVSASIRLASFFNALRAAMSEKGSMTSRQNLSSRILNHIPLILMSTKYHLRILVNITVTKSLNYFAPSFWPVYKMKYTLFLFIFYVVIDIYTYFIVLVTQKPRVLFAWNFSGIWTVRKVSSRKLI